MKILVVLVAVLAVSFGATSQDRSLFLYLFELNAFIPAGKLDELWDYYLKNDEEFRNVIDSGYMLQINKLFRAQPEFSRFCEWFPEQGTYFGSGKKIIDFNVHNNYKPGFKGYIENYRAIFPFEEIANFVEEKIAEGGIFAEFWSRQQALRPAFERVLRSPEYISIVESLKALGFDLKQYERQSWGDFKMYWYKLC